MATFFTYFLTQNFKKPPNLVTLIVGDNLGKEKGRRLGTGGRMLLSVYSRCRNSLSRCLSSPSLSLSFSSSLHLTHHPSVSLSLPLSLYLSPALTLSISFSTAQTEKSIFSSSNNRPNCCYYFSNKGFWSPRLVC